MSALSLTLFEKRAIFGLSLIMALRMVALFMALPLFALYANTLEDATPFLIGLAIGIYGLFQAFLQIPLGMLSDQYGRKTIITVGLCIFILGSFLSGYTESIWSMILGRALQGSGAVGSTLLALLADCTRIEKRTQAMAITGIGIGAAFGIAMLAGPLLNQWFNVGDLFLFSAFLGMVILILLYTIVPDPTTASAMPSRLQVSAIKTLLRQPELWRLNSGIFILHTLFSASFVAIPFNIIDSLHVPITQHWTLYAPSLMIAFPISFFCIGMVERTHSIKSCFLLAISILLISELLFLLCIPSTLFIIFALSLFFIGFTLLEGFLPSLVSRAAPLNQKGGALGIYSCAQFLGIFAGGILGGFIYGYLNTKGVYLFCFFLSLIWLSFAFSMQSSQHFYQE